MTGETNLEKLIASMEPVLRPGEFVFMTFPFGERVPNALEPVMLFHEAEGTTIIVDKETADHLELEYVFPCHMITLNVHSALEAVGFMAQVATVLAEAGIPVNPVAGYFHDHIFVPSDRADDALSILQLLAAKDH
ncbi:ACT domain-containing protein [Aestuariispira ectoiniformans]|uniref:ACT domain-containing protein n=1 Tax=Aestuariispira ectoiniformans TaxID=2775080 RepID=UPI00223A6DDC|nr:ACT domain-containing protein [Aestuariispira ectoiniformans]